MASTGITNGTLISIYKVIATVNTKIANATSNDFTITKDMIETTNKDSAGAKEYIAGEYGYTMSVEGMFEEDASVGALISWKEIIADLMAGTEITIVMTSAITGDLKLSGAALFSDLKLTAPQNAVSTFTASIQGTGALTVSVIA